MNDEEREGWEKLKKEMDGIKRRVEAKRNIEFSDEDDEEIIEGCCDNINKTEKCVTQELDTSVR